MESLCPGSRRGRWRALLLGAAALWLGGCDTMASLNPFGRGGPGPGTPGFVRGFLGGIAADDPAAALAGRNVLAAGGTAVDAAGAAGFIMAVTLPSRVGIGGGAEHRHGAAAAARGGDRLQRQLARLPRRLRRRRPGRGADGGGGAGRAAPAARRAAGGARSARRPPELPAGHGRAGR